MSKRNGNRRGPKDKVDASAKRVVYACLSVGASLRDTAGYLGVDYKTLYRARKRDPVFANGVLQAVLKGKLKLLKKVAGARQWQAAAWMLERKWGSEWGRAKAEGAPAVTVNVTQLSENDLVSIATRGRDGVAPPSPGPGISDRICERG